jgi:uncharacterized delta-60 repeat protein
MQVSKFNFLYFLAFVFIFQTNIFAAGIIDQTFGSNGTLNLNFGNQTNAVDTDVKTDGKIVVAGTVANAISGKDIFVARYNQNGSLDTTFGTNGVTITVTNLDETINDLEIQPDGKIVLVGRQQVFEGVTTIFDFLVVRYNSNGQLDSTFGNNGFVTVNQNQADVLDKTAVQADGKIVVVGNTVESVKKRVILRLNANGSLDSTFGSGGFWFENYNNNFPRTETEFKDVEILDDGRIIAGFGYNAETAALGGSLGFNIKVLNNTGELFTTSFAGKNPFIGFNGNSFDSELLPNGLLAVTSGIGVFIYNPNLNLYVKSFTQNGTSLAKFADGTFAVSGGQYRGNLRTYSSNAFVGSAWNIPTGKIAVQSNGRLLVLSNNSVTRVKNLTSQATRTADFDNDGKSDLIVYRTNTNSLYFLKGNGGYTLFNPILSGSKKFIPEYSESFPFVFPPESYRNTIIYWSNGIFREERAGNAGITTAFGSPNDLPIGGDYDGDGNTNIATFSTNGDWTYRDNQNIDRGYHWGTTSDKPVPADYDNDGITDYAIFRPSTGVWWIHRSSNDSYFTVPFGLSSDIPLTGDYDADGKADFVVYRPSTGTWYLQMTTEGFKAVNFGLPTDIPVPGDYDGDGKHDIAVFRNGIWYLLQSRDGFAGIQWGTTGDIPVTVRYDN